MPILGAHTSIAGGIHKAIERMLHISGEGIQIFTTNQRQWRSRPVDSQEITRFRSIRRKAGNPFVVSHASYLINLASSDEEISAKSVAALAQELVRCQILGIRWVVVHPGSHGGAGKEKGIENTSRRLYEAVQMAGPENRVGILIETVAGQGTSVGSTFEELAAIIDQCGLESRIGVCVDTCHIFAAGYDIRTREAYRETMNALHETIGIDKVRLFHMNDSKKEIGSRIDRHEHIGKGYIGLEGFEMLLNDPILASHPMVIETPKGRDMKEDIENLEILRSLMKG